MLLLSALSFALLASAVNVLTAVLALVGNLFYVVVYTRWLKRSTPQNIVIGGAAGAVPPLVGYAAATGSLGAAGALALPHRLPVDAAALLGACADDQERVRGRRCPDAPGRARGPRDGTPDRALLDRDGGVHRRCRTTGSARSTPSAAVVLGAAFLTLAVLLRRDLSRARAQVLFHYSLAYLALLFAAAALDPVIL